MLSTNPRSCGDNHSFNYGKACGCSKNSVLNDFGLFPSVISCVRLKHKTEETLFGLKNGSVYKQHQFCKIIITKATS